jgi:hypothetical protein
MRDAEPLHRSDIWHVIWKWHDLFDQDIDWVCPMSPKKLPLPPLEELRFIRISSPPFSCWIRTRPLSFSSRRRIEFWRTTRGSGLWRKNAEPSRTGEKRFCNLIVQLHFAFFFFFFFFNIFIILETARVKLQNSSHLILTQIQVSNFSDSKAPTPPEFPFSFHRLDQTTKLVARSILNDKKILWSINFVWSYTKWLYFLSNLWRVCPPCQIVAIGACGWTRDLEVGEKDKWTFVETVSFPGTSNRSGNGASFCKMTGVVDDGGGKGGGSAKLE